MSIESFMLSRVLEPEVMDSPDEARDYDAMDHAAVNRLFVTDFLFAALAAGLLKDEGEATVEESSPRDRRATCDVLDLGTGTAQIPIELCRRAPLVRVMAAEQATAMLNLAQLNVELAGLRKRHSA